MRETISRGLQDHFRLQCIVKDSAWAFGSSGYCGILLVHIGFHGLNLLIANQLTQTIFLFDIFKSLYLSFCHLHKIRYNVILEGP